MITKNRKSIIKYNGGEILVHEVNEDGSYKSGASWMTLGFIRESGISDVSELDPNHDERGHTVDASPLVREPRFNALLMQSDAKVVNFLKEGCRGKYFAIWQLSASKIGDNQVQEVFIPIARIKPAVELKSGTRNPAFNAMMLVNDDIVEFANGLTIESFVPFASYTTGEVLKNGTHLYQVTAGGSTGSTGPSHTEGSDTIDGVTYLYVGEKGTITAPTPPSASVANCASVKAEEYYTIIDI